MKIKFPFTFLCLLPILLSAGNLPLSFEGKTCDVSKIENDVLIICKISVSANMAELSNAQILEKEIDASATGDFIDQSISPLSGLPNLSHSPFPEPISLDGFEDNVTIIIDLKKPYLNGSLVWEIPTLILDKDGKILGEFFVKQEYFLNHGVLTLKKGGVKLIEIDLNSL